MRTVQCVVATFLAISLGVRAETPVRVFATIPNEGLLQNVNTNTRADLFVPGQGQEDVSLMKDVEVIGFISKNGDIFELDKTRSIGSIEPRGETDPEPGMTMCRYGNIVVYSDEDCNTFLRPSNTGAPVKSEKKDVEQTAKPRKRKNSYKRNPARNKRKNKKTPVRRKAPKKTGNNNRRLNKLKQKQKSKRRTNFKTKNKQQNQRRGNRKNKKRKRVSYDGDW